MSLREREREERQFFLNVGSVESERIKRTLRKERQICALTANNVLRYDVEVKFGKMNCHVSMNESVNGMGTWDGVYSKIYLREK